MSDASIFVAIFAGVASFISPCVLPLLPGYLSLMSGYSVGELSDGDVSLRRVAGRTALFVGGFTAVFVALGASATTVGGFLFRERLSFQVIAGWLVILMGAFIAVTAVWSPRILMPLMRERRVEVRPSRLGSFGPPVMGAAFAFGWTPCLGPFLGATLTLGLSSETVGEGMLLLFFYSVGLGVPFLISALLLAKAFSAFDRIKKYLVPVTIASGVVLASFGVLLVTNQLTALNKIFSDVLIWMGLDRLTEV